MRPSRSSRRRKQKSDTNAEPFVDVYLEPSDQRRFDICVAVLILAFGLYESILFFGAYPVPNPDYPGFINVGKELLNFQLPSNYKRAPLLGLMQVSLGSFFGGANPVLTASWVLNDIFGMANILLFWLVGKRLIGKAAIWIAFIAMLNPMVVRLQLVPIAETAIIFFSLITFYFMFKGSKWTYFFAGAASMVRYEGAALIFIAFLMDMVTQKNKKDRIRSFVFAAIASVPFVLWILGMVLSPEKLSSSNYFELYKGDVSKKVGFRYVAYIFSTAFIPLLHLPSVIKATYLGVSSQQQANSLQAASASLTGFVWFTSIAGCVIGIIGGIVRRNWKLLAIILYLVLFSTAHGLRANTQARYAVPLMWPALLLCCCGFQYFWRTVNFKKWMPKIIISVLQVITIVFFFVWMFRLTPYLPKSIPGCVKAASMPYVTLAAIATIVIIRLCFYKFRNLKADLALTAVVCVLLVSQHYNIVRQVGNGTYNIEFKLLADWYTENAQPGEKMASTWTHILKMINSKHEEDFVQLTSCGGKTFRDIVEKCYQKDLTYVTWTNRGSMPTRQSVMALHPHLAKEQDYYPFKYLTHWKFGKRWIYVYRLLPRDEDALNKKFGN